MIFRHNHTLIVVSLFAVISGTPAAAYEIFQWVDRDGVTHYSQWEPSADTAEVTKLELITGRERSGITSATIADATAHSPPTPIATKNRKAAMCHGSWASAVTHVESE